MVASAWRRQGLREGEEVLELMPVSGDGLTDVY